MPLPTLPTLPCTRCGLALLTLATLLAGAPAHAAMDSSALTDDHSINVPTAWWTYADMSPAALADKLAMHQARLTDLEVTGVTSAGEPRFVARMVANSGAYAVPGWSWHHGQTAAQVTTLLNANTGRLIELERYDRGGGQIRYAVVMVPNSGSAARGWSYLLDATAAQVSAAAGGQAMRPIDLDSHGSGGSQRFNAIFVANTGTDAKPFEWGTGQTPTGIASRANAFQGRVVKLERQADGKYAYVLVKRTGADATAWWHQYGFASLGDLNNYAHQFAARPVDIVSYVVGTKRVFDAAFIDNANPETRRMRGQFAAFTDASGNPRGIFQSYLKRIDTGVMINLNGSRRAESASTLKVLHLLHAMRQVQAGSDVLNALFYYYDYFYYTTSHDLKDRCPSSEHETESARRSNTLEWGADRMIDDSDNRTTRGMVLRYGGFAPINQTAAWAGLTGTTLRHNIGCGYWDPVAEALNPAGLRNDTTAADLARIFEGVHKGTLLTSVNRAREEFLESTFHRTGAWPELQAIINQEAATLGKSSAAAAEFGAQVKHWGKGGAYDTCLALDPAEPGACAPGAGVVIRGAAGLMRLSLKSGAYIAHRYLSYGTLISDVVVSDTDPADRAALENAWSKARLEIYRGEIRAALAGW